MTIILQNVYVEPCWGTCAFVRTLKNGTLMWNLGEPELVSGTFMWNRGTCESGTLMWNLGKP